jgi:glycosyltransferase involved in cell wall biosynthesis
MDTPELSLIIPTYNERPNIEPLLAEIDSSLHAIAWEALFVDDSTDGTDNLIAGLAKADTRIRLLHRRQNRGGLAGAVVAGLAQARGTYICVLDADLQHPPALIPKLLERAWKNRADIVVASRYRPGGSAGGLSGPMRQLFSQGSRRLAQVLFPMRLWQISDPGSGFFLVRRAILQGVSLRPIGFKCLMEILVRCPWQRASEVPYRFRPRRGGTSKADFRQGRLFLQHLGRLVRDRWPAAAVLPPRARR